MFLKRISKLSSAVLLTSACGLAHAGAGVFSPEAAEEGQRVTFSWTWPVGVYNAGCTISGIPGFNASNRDTNASTSYTFTAGTSKVVATLNCANIVSIGGGAFMVDNSINESTTMLLKPTMSISYPDNVTVPEGHQKGVYAGIAYLLKFYSKNADRCELRTMPLLPWSTIKTGSYESNYQYDYVPAGNYETLAVRCSNASGTFQLDHRFRIDPYPGTIPSPNVSINSFTHGNYEYGKTWLSWSTTNAKTCNMSRNDGVKQTNVGTTGLAFPKVDVGYVYTLTCFGNNGSSAEKSLTVAQPDYPNVIINEFSAENFHSGEAALRWSTSFAKWCDITGTNGYSRPDAGISGIATLRVPVNQQYTLKCHGFNGSSTSKSLSATYYKPPVDVCVQACAGEMTDTPVAVSLSADDAIFASAQTLTRDGETYKVVALSAYEHQIYRFDINTDSYVPMGIMVSSPSQTATFEIQSDTAPVQ